MSQRRPVGMEPSSAFRWGSVAVVIALLLAACGTTGQEGSTVSGPQEAGASPARDEVDTSKQQQEEAPRPAEREGVPGAQAEGSAAVATPSGPGGPAGPPQDLVTGKGVTDTSVLVGIPWLDPTKFAAAVGAVGGFDADIGDQQAQAQAVVDHINAHGGFLGYAIEPIYYEIDAAEYASGDEGRAREAERMCARWTEDNQVFVMLSLGWAHDNLVSCAKRTETPLVAAGTAQYVDRKRFEEVSDFFYTVNGFIVNRRELNLAGGLLGQGFFEGDAQVDVEGGAKVGLLIEGNFAYFERAAERTLKPFLEERGVEVAAEIVYPDFIQSPWSTYVLQFQQRGVTHVYFGATNGSLWAPLFFMRAAEDQQYRPQYGVGSDHGLNTLSGQAPEEQLRGAQGVGWLPRNDRSFARVEEPVSSNDSRCRKIMTEARQPESGGLVYCDTLLFLDLALDQTGALTWRGLVEATESLGDAWPPVSTFGTRFGPGRHDGADLVRDHTFDGECGCFAYTSGLRDAR